MNTKRNTFSFRIIHASSAFLFPNFISPDGLTKKAEKKKMPIPNDGIRLFRYFKKGMTRLY